ncbi:MAG TPA: nitric-oxide reductase large subunit [Steroidobacteraceae bacterium]|jgi:nitric oxide reductase subunit B|nr:nitric-oxide reductase large subunit [Steroidobacteraceae bacterium]
MTETRHLWKILGAIMALSFGILLFLGREIYLTAPPVPAAVKTTTGQTLFTEADIQTGREVWQTVGGQQLGSIWGHGGYVAPDWSADWLHREATGLLGLWAAREHGKSFDALTAEQQAGLQARLKQEMRTNTYDPNTRELVVSEDRAQVMAQVADHYEALFGSDLELNTLRSQYAMKLNTVADPARREALTTFFFWTSWSTTTNRPDDDVTYTSNWPSEPLVGNTPTAPTFMWTFVSVFMMLAGIGALAWYHASVQGKEPAPVVPDSDPLKALKPTASMKATAKYFWVVTALILVQVVLGGITAHYAVEGQSFYGIPLSEILPYSVTRSWHLQLAVLWIATAWLATGLYIAPAISGHEPKFQRLGVNFLFTCLLVIVVGALGGQWFAVMQKMGLAANFWFGHQGYEYTDIGRFWQIFLFVGLMLWLLLVGRALWPALKRRDDSRSITMLLFLSTIAIGLFYGAGLMWGRNTHLSMVEYWRWWVVHLWVEGFFEVFATAVIAFLFTKLGLVRGKSATSAVLFATVIFLTGGVLGTLHHLYWTGTPTSVLAFGAAFSALEVVPLVLIGFEAYENYKHSKAKPWIQAYRWPILFFVSVAFWNLVGAGLFGFLINPPIALYYMQGLNTTPLHGHTALFGVYGMLGIGLMLFCLRGLSRTGFWDERLLKGTFWTLNIGLATMALLSLAPVGLMQVYAAVTEGFWYARSAEFLQQPLMQTLVWLRMPGDVIFSVGVCLLALFVFRLFVGKRKDTVAVGTPAGVEQAASGSGR